MPPGLRPREILDLLVISYLIYQAMLLVRGTAARQGLPWLAALALTYWVAVRTGLALTAWAVRSAAWVALVAFVILFRHELREALARTGPLELLLGHGERPGRRGLEAITTAAFHMAASRTGALLVVQGRDRLPARAGAGVELGAVLTPQLLESLFTAGGPLHDGAVVIRGHRVERAGAVLPLSLRPDLPPGLGTRHRAALGLSERTDAVVVVVSEERGTVSIVAGGTVFPAEGPEQAEELLRRLGGQEDPDRRPRRRARVALRRAGGLLAVVLAVSLFGWASDLGDQARATVSVPIDFRNLPAGLELRGPAADPVRVQVAGRRFLVEGLRSDQVTLHVDLEGAEPGVQAMALGTADVDVPPGLEVTAVDPARITVRLERRGSKRVPVVPVSTAPGPEAGPTTWCVEPTAVLVTGPESEVGRLDGVRTRPVDLTGVRRSDLPRRFEVGLELSPASLRLAEGELKRVLVTVGPGAGRNAAPKPRARAATTIRVPESSPLLKQPDPGKVAEPPVAEIGQHVRRCDGGRPGDPQPPGRTDRACRARARPAPAGCRT